MSVPSTTKPKTPDSSGLMSTASISNVLDSKSNVQSPSAVVSTKMSSSTTESFDPSLTIKQEFKASTSPSTTATSLHRGWKSGEQIIYKSKLLRLKRQLKDTVFMNGAICDEVLRTEEKLARAKEERRFLLRKLLQQQSVSESLSLNSNIKSDLPAISTKIPKGGQAMQDWSVHEPSITRPKGGKRKNSTAAATQQSTPTLVSTLPSRGPGLTQNATPPSSGKKKGSMSAEAPGPGKPPTKKGKGAARKMIPPLMLDPLGRPVFPMALGDVTLHSIGEIVPDRSAFHCPESIFPVGYCSTRLYASVIGGSSGDPPNPCLYTCKVSDGDDGPVFEIAAEDSSELVFKSTSPDQCHIMLLKAFNNARGEQIVPSSEGRGLDFFGLSHPVIQNLIQSCPGARKCARYKWIKFEINKAESNENVAVGTQDSGVGLAALAQLMGQGSEPQGSNLRSLLTQAAGSKQILA